MLRIKRTKLIKSILAGAVLILIICTYWPVEIKTETVFDSNFKNSFKVKILEDNKSNNNRRRENLDFDKIKYENLNIEANLTEIKKDDKYILEISETRINKLFDILHDKEIVYGTILNSLNLISFNDYILDKSSVSALNDFKEEADTYLRISDNRVRVTKEFIKYLYNKSDVHSFRNPRTKVVKNKILKENEKPVIVTAANTAYYGALQATVFHIHQQYPDYHLIVYDLGLDADLHQITVDNCKCEVIKFDFNGSYSKISPHVSDPKTYAWKPLLIQETLKKHETVVYIDSSIRFQSNEISPLISALKDVGMLTQFIGLNLNCYTNPKMFDWFGERSSSYSQFFTVEANILLFHRSFLTSLLMKAWITCALDKNCIAPPGSSIGGCCGCHRFDQDAITIVNSFFYGHPTDKSNYLPAYSFTKEESYFFEIRRYESKQYFVKH